MNQDGGATIFHTQLCTNVSAGQQAYRSRRAWFVHRSLPRSVHTRWRVLHGVTPVIPKPGRSLWIADGPRLSLEAPDHVRSREVGTGPGMSAAVSTIEHVFGVDDLEGHG